MKQRMLYTGVVFSLVSVGLAACSDQSVTGVVAAPNRPSYTVASIASGSQICSGPDGANMVVTPKNDSWAPPVTGSLWVGKTATSSTDRTRLAIDAYTTTFSVPLGATNIAVAGHVLADNDVVINGGGGDFFNTGAGGYPPSQPDGTTYGNFQTPGGKAFGRTSGFTAGVDNTVTFTVYNDDNPNLGQRDINNVLSTGNPSGLSFCYTVTYTPAPPVRQIAMFVIGDVEAHAVGDVVNFWGSQWWKNNTMSGFVSNGVASFKGYAVTSTNVCGGTWTSLPGNSSNPPETIPADVLIIVTSKVIKNGNDISGDIKQMVTVHHDGVYQDNPGHHGGGKVINVVCP